MAESDYIVCSVPYTPDTHHIVSAAAIAAMKPTGVFINVGRGKCVDEEALVEGEGGVGGQGVPPPVPLPGSNTQPCRSIHGMMVHHKP